MRKGLVLLLGLLVVFTSCSAGCTSVYMEEPIGEIVSFYSTDGYTWTGYARVTNMNNFDVEADITWNLIDKYGYTVVEGYSHINKIPAMSSKHTQVTVRSNRCLDQVAMEALCTFRMI